MLGTGRREAGGGVLSSRLFRGPLILQDHGPSRKLLSLLFFFFGKHCCGTHNSLKKHFIFYYYFFLAILCGNMGPRFPGQEWNPHPLLCEHRVLTPGPSGKSYNSF